MVSKRWFEVPHQGHFPKEERIFLNFRVGGLFQSSKENGQEGQNSVNLRGGVGWVPNLAVTYSCLIATPLDLS